MEKNKAQKEKIYTTLDSYTAGYLSLQGFTPQLIEQGNKIVFCFDATPELFQIINEYNITVFYLNELPSIKSNGLSMKQALLFLHSRIEWNR